VAANPELTLNELKEFVKNLDRSFLIKPSIHLFGGEPLLHKDVLEFIKYLNMEKFKCSITTNGFPLEEHAQALVDFGVSHINVSIDGPEAIHDRGRNAPGAFRKALRGIQLIDSIKKAIKIKVNPKYLSIVRLIHQITSI